MDIKGTCQHCSQNFTFPSNMAGDTTACPHCGQNTVLQASSTHPAAPSPAPAPALVKIPASRPPPTPSQPAPPLDPGVPPLSAPAAASARAGSETPAEFLQRVRQHSCYKELRSVIGVVSAVFFLAAAVAGLVGCVILSNDAAGAISYKIPAAIACFVAAPVFVLLGLAFYQSLSLIVDIADIELEANRNK